MKIKDLIAKPGRDNIIKVNGSPLTEAYLNLEIRKIDMRTEGKEKENLESLGYSFKIGV